MRPAVTLLASLLAPLLLACSGAEASSSWDSGAPPDGAAVSTGCGDSGFCDAGGGETHHDGSARPSSAAAGACLILFDPSQPLPGVSKLPGQACQNPAQCGTYSCVGGICPFLDCVHDDGRCASDADCCDRGCVNGTCSGTPFCRARGTECDAGTQCLEGVCTNGLCGTSTCVLGAGAACARDYDCCSLACGSSGCVQ
jgi:hypothetical protein